MESTSSNKQDVANSSKYIKKQLRIPRTGIYTKSIIHRPVYININEVSSSIKETIELIIKSEIEGICIPNGFVKPNSVNVLSYSGGKIQNGMIRFDSTIECLLCNPVEGVIVSCKIRNITKAGIRAEVNEAVVPIVVFVSRDHSVGGNDIEYSINQEIAVRVIGARFELGDPYVSVIAEIMN